MSFVDCLSGLVANLLIGISLSLDKTVHYFFQQVRMVGFEGQHVVRLLHHKLLGNLPLTAYRVNRDHTAAER